MKIFFRLLLAHLISDYLLQTDFIAKWKRKNFIGVLVHSSIFLIFGLILTFDDLNKIWFKFPGWLSVLILFFLHLIEDEYRANNVRHFNKEDTLSFFLWDQFLHVILIYLFSPQNFSTLEPIIIYLCILIIGTFFISVLTLYIDNFYFGNEVAYFNFRAKYYYIFLRLFALLLFLLPDNLFLFSLVFIPLSILIRNKIGKISNIGFIVHLITPYILGTIFLLINNYFY